MAGRPCGFMKIQNSMKMIRHDHVRAQINVSKSFWQIQPFPVNDFAEIIQPHLPIYHLAKQTIALIRDDGDEIRARLCVIISLQADGFSVVYFWIEFGMCVTRHGVRLFGLVIPTPKFHFVCRRFLQDGFLGWASMRWQGRSITAPLHAPLFSIRRRLY